MEAGRGRGAVRLPVCRARALSRQARSAANEKDAGPSIPSVRLGSSESGRSIRPPCYMPSATTPAGRPRPACGARLQIPKQQKPSARGAGGRPCMPASDVSALLQRGRAGTRDDASRAWSRRGLCTSSRARVALLLPRDDGESVCLTYEREALPMGAHGGIHIVNVLCCRIDSAISTRYTGPASARRIVLFSCPGRSCARARGQIRPVTFVLYARGACADKLSAARDDDVVDVLVFHQTAGCSQPKPYLLIPSFQLVLSCMHAH